MSAVSERLDEIEGCQRAGVFANEDGRWMLEHIRSLAAKVVRVEALIASWAEPKDAHSIVVKNHFDLGQTQGIDIGVDAVLADLRDALTEGTE